MAFVEVTKKDHIAVVTMNRPEALNALNKAVFTDLEVALDDVERDDEVYVCLLYTSIAPTALAPDGKGLENSMDTNALCQLSEPVRVKVSAGLVGVGRNIIRRYHGHPGAFHQPSSI